MKILNANTNQAKDEVWELLEQMPNKMCDYTRLRQWLDTSIGTEVFNVWIAVEGDETVGFITAEIVNEIEPKVYLAFCWGDKKHDAIPELLETAESWAIEQGIRKLLFYTQRNPMPFIKKYGFELRKAELTKEI